MVPFGRIGSVLSVVLVAVLSVAAAGAAALKHSGTVVRIDRAAGTLVVGEVGPWRVRDGVTEVTPVTISLVPETRFALVRRAPAGGPAIPGDFVETALAPDVLAHGDFVTVECRHEGKRMIALKVTLIRPE